MSLLVVLIWVVIACGFNVILPCNGQISQFPDWEFNEKVQQAIAKTKDFLRNNKFPVFATHSNHVYEDKYQLAEYLVGAAQEALLRTWQHIGISNETLTSIHTWAKENRTVHMKFSAQELCHHKEFRVYDVEVGSATVAVEVESAGFFGTTKETKNTVQKTFRTVNESVWAIDVTYALVVYPGTDEHMHIPLYSNSMHTEVTTPTYHVPYPPRQDTLAEVEISELLRGVDVDWNNQERSIRSIFRINRSDPKCHTPRRNGEVDDVLLLGHKISSWLFSVRRFFTDNVGWHHDKFDMSSKLQEPTQSIFLPVIPVFFPHANRSDCLAADDAMKELDASAPEKASNCGITATSEILSLFLLEEEKTLGASLRAVKTLFMQAQSGKLMSPKEAELLVVLIHSQSILGHLLAGTAFLESMLTSQLVAALGKTLTAADFNEYMEFHNRRVFAPAFAPNQFTYSIRRGESYSPEGLLSIEATSSLEGAPRNNAISVVSRQFTGSTSDSLVSSQPTVAGTDNSSSLSAVEASHLASLPETVVPLSAGVSVMMGGSKYLHSWIMHTFSEPWIRSEQAIVAQARQFSSFILIVGRLVASNSFKPEYAMIVRDKDHVQIPLDVSVIPSAQEFRDATGSLSPEQRQFAKSYRSMQLGQTVLAFAVIQIKPQLEKVLNLPPGSLTKEIKLTQDLMELFIDYQIPSDMLSFGGDVSVVENVGERLAAVKLNVAAIKQLINATKTEQLESARLNRMFGDVEMGAPEGISLRSGSMSAGNGGSVNIVGGSSIGGSAGALRMKSGSSRIGDAGFASSTFSGAVRFQTMSLSAEPTAQPSSYPSSYNPREPVDLLLADQVIEPADVADVKVEISNDSELLNNDLQQDFGSRRKLSQRGAVDFSQIPLEMESRFDGLGAGMSIRPAVVTPRNAGWRRRRHASLLSPATTEIISDEALNLEKTRAFELLDALTRSGGLVVEHATLHVVVANAHVFDKTLMATVVEDNINPIEKAEQAMLLSAAIVHREEVEKLVSKEHSSRLLALHKKLLAGANQTAH